MNGKYLVGAVVEAIIKAIVLVIVIMFVFGQLLLPMNSDTGYLPISRFPSQRGERSR